MYNRKEFLKLSGGVSMALLLGNCVSANKTPSGAGTIKNLGLQLYSLRDDLPKDPKGVLKQVASFGYKQVESFEGEKGMFWGMTNKEFKAYMDDLGMKMVSSHCDFTKDFERKAAEAAEIGMKYLICPWVGEQKSLDDYKKFADKFNAAGEICKKSGIRFAYHNHNYSFIEKDGQFPQDIFINNTDPSLVDYEMDIYWVVTAGQDPNAWFSKYKNRFKLAHIKDRQKGVQPTPGEDNKSCIVGTGSIDYKSILSKAKNEGLEYYIVEQEAYEKAPIDCVKEDAAYLNQLVF